MCNDRLAKCENDEIIEKEEESKCLIIFKTD